MHNPPKGTIWINKSKGGLKMSQFEKIYPGENKNFKGDHFYRELLLNVFDYMAYLKNILGKIIRWKKSIKYSPNYGEETTLPQWERFSRKFALCFQEVNRLTEKVNPEYKAFQRVYKDLGICQKWLIDFFFS